jgi:sporulation protein YlmC with PRC-barrel domain
MIYKTLSAVALATVLAAPAFAQQAPTPSTAPMAQPAKPDTAAKPDDKAAQSTPMSDQNKSNAMSDTSGTKDTKSTMGNAPGGEKQAGFVQSQSPEEWRASKLIGSSVYGSDNKSIGEINDVIVAGDGNIKAVVVGVGGFLGVGEKSVAIPFDSLNVTRKADSSSIDKITVSFGKDELKNAPKFAYYEAPKSSSSPTTGSSAGMKPSPAPTPMKK